MSERTEWTIDPKKLSEYSLDDGREMVTPGSTNTILISSLLENGKHSPLLDIDFPARLVSSSTPGHFHLYLDGIEMSWDKYERLLNALQEAGVIQEGFARLSKERGASFGLKPGITKEQIRKYGDG